MREETVGGWSMVAAAAMMLVTMAFHPGGADVARDGGALSVAVHSLALFAIPLGLYGVLVLTRRLSPGPLAEMAFVFQCVAAVAGILAAVASGFLSTQLIVRMQGLTGPDRMVAGSILHFTGSLNQACARVLVASSSIAIGLWSVQMLRAQRFSRVIALLGCVVAAGAIVALLAGLPLDVHGFGAIVLAQSAWLVATGLRLRRVPAGGSSGGHAAGSGPVAA